MKLGEARERNRARAVQKVNIELLNIQQMCEKD
jgi:hypothetical protein